MSHRIARCLFEPLLRFLLPGTGRRRRTAPATRAAEVRPPAPEYAPLRIAERPPHREDHALVRPYLVAHERREQARRQRARRRALWLAVHGIDVGPRVIHGVEVTA
ncbi:hypothetical protein [Streptomyces blattellae]|uniref:hypothetical protein n=1 Tax=Streptomyces blattellae TaxID=2569855 RepID=UPI0012B9E026|nr:hypothetical protein [Streptomyces blattellae]